MEYIRFELRDELTVRRLISFSYKELSSGYAHKGERHDFWELAYLDKGEAWITTDAGEQKLAQGELVFYRPNEFHSLRTEPGAAPNLFIAAFDCYSPAMDRLGGQLFALGEEERRLLARMIEEGGRIFERPIRAPRVEALRRAPSVPFGAEQLLRLHLETLLLGLARRTLGAEPAAPAKPPSLLQHNKDAELTEAVIAYMRERLSEELTIERLCEAFAVGKSQLTKAFRASQGAGVIETLAELRFEAAKAMIRGTAYNLTEIGERLGYNSIHSFSKAFKKSAGMTPSEYARSAKALAPTLGDGRGSRTARGSSGDPEAAEPFQNDIC